MCKYWQPSPTKAGSLKLSTLVSSIILKCWHIHNLNFGSKTQKFENHQCIKMRDSHFPSVCLKKLNLDHPLFCIHHQWFKPTEMSWWACILPSEHPDSYSSVAASMSSHKCLWCQLYAPRYYPGLHNLGCYLTSSGGCAMLPQGNSGLPEWVCLWTTSWPLATYKASVSLFPKWPGRAGRLPEKPRQLPVLPVPRSSGFFRELIVTTIFEQ